MNNIEYKIIPLTKENKELLETLRFNAYQYNQKNLSLQDSFYLKDLNENKYLCIGCFLNNQLLAACYIKNTYHSLYIEQLFVLEKYQKTSLHIGSNLLKYILNNKEIVEKHFNETFYYSYLDNAKNTKEFYQKLGYQEKDFLMRKKL